LGVSLSDLITQDSSKGAFGSYYDIEISSSYGNLKTRYFKVREHMNGKLIKQ
jgi:hypothetical protein